MRIRLDLDVGPSPNPNTLSDLYAAATALETDHKYRQDIIEQAAKPPMVSSDAPDVAEELETVLEAESEPTPATETAKRGPGRPRKAAAPPQPPLGVAVPPSVQTQEPAMPKLERGPGRPRKLSPEAPPGIAIPPGMQAQPAPANGESTMTLDDLKEVCRQINAVRPNTAFQVMKRPAYSDGTPHEIWYTLDRVPPSEYEHLAADLAAAVA